MTERLYTIDEVARLTRLHIVTVRKHTLSGALRSVQVGPRAIRVTSAALRSFIQKRGGIRPVPKPRTKGRWKKRATVRMTDALRQRIATLRAKGRTYQQIADATGASKGAVWIACGSPHVADRPKRKRQKARGRKKQ